MSNLSRRRLIQTGLAAGAFLTAKGCASNSSDKDKPRSPELNANKIKDVTLRFIGTGVSQINEVAEQIQKDLGFKVDMRALSTEENNQIAITQPKQYDIFDGEYFSLPLVIPSGNLQPIDVSKIKEFDKIVPIFTSGELYENAPVNTSQGTAPRKVMFLKGEDSKEFSETPTNWATLLPFQYNSDTLGWRPDLV
ncbi:MAG: ABC transporter substrate-binding protein, partial [Spirulina sp.]